MKNVSRKNELESVELEDCAMRIVEWEGMSRTHNTAPYSEEEYFYLTLYRHYANTGHHGKQ